MANKFFLLIIVLIQLCFVAVCQNKYLTTNDTFKAKDLIIRNAAMGKSKVDKNFFFIALNYEFEDSISVMIGKKELYHGQLNYVQLDSNATHYPYNRVILKFSKKKLLSENSKCELFFWDSKLRTRFFLQKNTNFYILEIRKKPLNWYLTYSNAYPWTD